MSQKKPVPATLDNFLWGAATSSHQVEGNDHNNWSIWEHSVAKELATTAEARLKNEVPDWEAIKAEATDPQNYISGIADDHYNRYEEDFDILVALGCNAYRFAIEWSRVEPEPGVYSQEALGHYEAVVKALKKRGITPLVTLHSFPDPVWLEGYGGWHGRAAVERFAQYCEVVAKHLGDEVGLWCTINEPGSYMLMRYLGGGAWPLWPHMSFRPDHAYRYLRNVMKAHKRAAAVIKAANPGAKVGLAHSLIDYQLGRRDPLSWLVKQLLGYMPDVYLLNRLKHDVDYIGVNYYMRMVVKSRFSHPLKWVPKWNGQDPRNDMGWGVYPQGLYNVTQRLMKYNLPMYITENGIPDERDHLRAEFIRDHIAAMIRSRADGADICGYFHWSLLDNFEWSEGFWPKFGLVSVDRRTQKRTVRQSARVYADIIRQYQS